MPKSRTAQEIFVANAHRLMGDKEWKQPQVAAAAKKAGHSVNQTTVGRALRGGNATIGTLDAIAAALGVQAWQLLAPENMQRFPKAGRAPELMEYALKLNDTGMSAAIGSIKGLLERPEFQAAESKGKAS